MAEKQLLFACTDLQAMEDFKLALGRSWLVTHAPNGAAALAAVETQHFDVLVVDFDLFTVFDVEVLNVMQKTDIRLVLAAEAERSRVMKDVQGEHLFVPKPFNVLGLKSLIERALALDIWSTNADIRTLVSRVRVFPSLPSLYLEIQAALQSPDVTTERVSAIIGKDMAMTTKLLQLLNSAGFGLSREINDLNEAVGFLGFETVKSMVVTIKLISEFDQVKPAYFSIDRLWRRGTTVARMARRLTLVHNHDQAMAETAFAAGLLHDVGKAVLATTFDEQYQAVQLDARVQQAPLWEIEKENFGASHGEIGAHLLSIWGMPLDLMEAAAMHDHPSHCVSKLFAPVTAVHIAHVWENELNPENDGLLAPQIDKVYLKQLGLWDRLDDWRKAMSLPVHTKPAAVVKRRKGVRKPITVPKHSKKATQFFQGIYGRLIAAGAVVLMLLGYFAFGPVTGVAAKYRNESVAGTTKKPAAGILQSATPASPPKMLPQLATPAAVKGPTMQATVSNQSKPAEIIFPQLKLQGVFYSSNSPSAIINGRLVHLNGEIDGAHVVGIARSSVIIEYQSQRTNLSL